MANQLGKNVRVAFKSEGSSFNTAPGDTGAQRVRLNASQGLSLARAVIQPGEIRADGQTSMGRLGSRSVGGPYSGDLSLGSWDALLEAVMRGTWVAAVAITEATMTSITTGTNTIVAAAGSWLTQGVRVGDIVRLAGHSTAANNDRNLRVTGVTATTITVAETLTTDASPDSAFTLTVLRKLKNDNPKVRRSFYFEQYYEDAGVSEVFGGCRIHQVIIRGQPDGMATVEFMVTGVSGEPLASGASPYYTDPELLLTIGLVFTDAVIRFGGSDIAIATSFELTIGAPARTQPVIGANTSPDVYDEEIAVSGTFSVIREDLSRFAAFDAETELELSVLLSEPEDEPKDCVHLFVPRLKLTAASAPLGSEGPMIETLPFMAGKKEGVTGYDETMVTISTSHTP